MSHLFPYIAGIIPSDEIYPDRGKFAESPTRDGGYGLFHSHGASPQASSLDGLSWEIPSING